MATLAEIVAAHSKLEPRHRRALMWFLEREGQQVRWPSPLEDGTLLATRAKGIYKPIGSPYALSVRQTLNGPYPDHEISYLPDGSWNYNYYQENLEILEGVDTFTNRALQMCQRDAVPVGVMIQTQTSPFTLYRVVGLAFVNGWDAGYFQLSGVVRATSALDRVKLPVNRDATPSEIAECMGDAFDPAQINDDRKSISRSVILRQGQPGFRRILLKAYESRCVATDYDAPSALEAAHISPYRGPLTNHHSNGLLLRADIHSLFDLGLLAIRELDLSLVLSQKLYASQYWGLSGRRIATPIADYSGPSRESLRRHREWAGL